jgi:hypothetical protein
MSSMFVGILTIPTHRETLPAAPVSDSSAPDVPAVASL